MHSEHLDEGKTLTSEPNNFIIWIKSWGLSIDVSVGVGPSIKTKGFAVTPETPSFKEDRHDWAGKVFKIKFQSAVFRHITLSRLQL